MTLEAIITSVIFVAVFAFILSEKIDRMVVSICGATAMIIVGDILDFYDYKQALAMIELDTIILLLGMMTLISMLEKTGAFEYMAIKIAQLSKHILITFIYQKNEQEIRLCSYRYTFLKSWQFFIYFKILLCTPFYCN